MISPLSASDHAKLEEAQRKGYLVRNSLSIMDPVASPELRQAFEHWSTEQLRPYILVMKRGNVADIILSFTALTRHLHQLGRLKPGHRPVLAPTDALRPTVERIREQYVRPSPSGIENGSPDAPEYLNIAQVYLDSLVNELLALYQHARPFFETDSGQGPNERK